MHYRWVAAVAIAGFVLASECRTAAAEKPVLKAGFAEADITPQIGMEQPGGYGKSYHRTIHDPCKVRVAIFDDGQRCVAIVGLDALGVGGDMVHNVRQAIAAKTPIPASAILVAASHSHSSGPICWTKRGDFDGASPLVQQLAYEKSTLVDPIYAALVEKQIVAAVCKAYASRAEARCGVAKGREDQVAFNRRFRMKNGLSFTHPGAGNPEIVEAAGPTDPEVGVIGVWGKDGKLMGCLVNFACHATTSPGGASANYVYYLEQVIRGMFGPEVVVVFTAGASGDVTQVNNLTLNARPQPEQWAMLVGGRVGAEAVKVLLSMTTSNLMPVDARQTILTIKRRVPKPEHVQKALELVQKDPKKVDATEWTFAKETVLLDAILAKQPTRQVEIQVVQVGPAVFMAIPAEYFCQFGLDMKAQSNFAFTFPVTLANDCVGYVPTEDAFSKHGGGYETRLTSYSNLEITAGRRFANTALELAGQLKPGLVPEPAKMPPAKTSWTYGSVPPELD